MAITKSKMKNLSILLLLLSSILVSGQVTSKKDTLIRNSNLVIKPRVKKIPEPTYAPVDLKRDIRNDNVAVPDYENNEDKIYSTAEIEVKPEFPGGIVKLLVYVKQNFVYSKEMITNNVSGKIVVNFIIEKNGNISDLKIGKHLGFGTEKEILRVLKKMPKWIAGEHNGKKVRCSYTLPINIDAASAKK